MARLFNIEDLPIPGKRLAVPDSMTDEEVVSAVNQYMDKVNSPKQAATQMADAEFELDVTNQTGPVVAPSVSGSKAKAVDLSPDFDVMKQSPILGMYIPEGSGGGDMAELFGKFEASGKGVLSRPRMTPLVRSMVNPEEEFAVGEVLGIGTPAFTSTKLSVANTMAHEFIHKAAAQLQIPQLKGEGNTRAYTAWRANSKGMWDHSINDYALYLHTANKEEYPTFEHAKNEALTRLMPGGALDQVFSEMEGRLLKQQEYPLPKKYGNHREMAAKEAMTRFSRFNDGEDTYDKNAFSKEEESVPKDKEKTVDEIFQQLKSEFTDPERGRSIVESLLESVTPAGVVTKIKRNAEFIARQGGALASKPKLTKIQQVLDDHGIRWVDTEQGIKAFMPQTKHGKPWRDSEKTFTDQTSLRTLRNWLGY